MSWDAYVKEQLMSSGVVQNGAIIGLDGSVWAASPNFTVAPKEAAEIVKAFERADSARAGGLFVNGEKYFLLGADANELKGKKGAGGVAVSKTVQAVIIGTYGDKMPPGQCNACVGKLADYLISMGY